MHLCMQDNQIGQKFMGLSPVDMARLPRLKIQKIVLVANNLIHLLGLHLHTLNLPFLWSSGGSADK
jgi:hypothetical protein